jgi:hypothetical protein
MRIREPVAVAVGVLATLCSPAAAQRTRDRPQLVFTVSTAYLDGVGLWTVPDQPLADLSGPPLVDHVFLSRSIKRTLSFGFSATYYRGAHLGLTAEAFLLGLGYQDSCRLNAPALSVLNEQRCNAIQRLDRSGAAMTALAGITYRVAGDEFLSPFIRATAGFLINNQSPLLVVGQADNGSELVIYDDHNKGPRLRPAFGLGVGATIAAGRGYQLRWEVRDNIVGIQQVTGPGDLGQVPPNRTVYKQIFGLLFGVDIILERRHGRRY